ncbi:MAG: EAL domain-containing protein [Burkholderiales bacterium]|nr:EAL domain-containing protein [Burkholderiales bacterium]
MNRKHTLFDLKALHRKLIASSSVLFLFGAFALIWLLMAGLGWMGLHVLQANNQRMEKIVLEHNVKIALVLDLRSINRERALTVHKMILSGDPFERDNLMLVFRELATSYVRQRDRLLSLPFVPEEQKAFEAAQDKIKESTRLMEEVVALTLDNRNKEAELMLTSQAIPAQNLVQVDFSTFLEYQNRSSEAAVRHAQDAYQRAYWGSVFLGGAALILGLLVSFGVIRRTANVERALAREKERAEVTLHSIGEAVITTDELGCVDHLNEMAERLTGWTNAEAVGLKVEDVYRVVDENHPTQVLNLAAYCLGDVSLPCPESSLMISRGGLQYTIEQTVSPIREADGVVIGMVVVFRDVTTERSLAHELAWQASHDALTSLANRHEFERRLQEVVESAQTSRISHALLYIDLDQFKLVNDTCGHVAGDELLRQLSTLLNAKIRTVDTLARLGGDEFGLLLPGCGIEQAQVIAEKLRQEISEFRFMWEAKTFMVGASIGLVEITHETGTVANLLSAADTACYMAKDRGRNRVCVHRAQDAEVRRLHGEAEWVTRITRAFEENRFQLYYQKIIPLHPDRHPEYREILLRLIDEAGRLVPPMAFIPAAERYTLMPTIDRWVVRTLFAWMRAHQHQLPENIYYSINLSGQSLGDDAFASFVEDQFRISDVMPSRICFEVTETAAISNLAQAMRMMKKLQAMGCGFSLDDFGSGMSSFAYLKNLPVDSIKVDGAFVRDMLTDPIDFAMVEAIIRIGHVMGLKTIAEYVESDAIMQRLAKLDVDYVQGFGMHRPEPLAP